MGLLASLLAYISLLWPVLAIGVIVFAAWGAGKEAAKASGRHLGIAGVGLVIVVLTILSWWVGQFAIAGLLGIVGIVVLFAGLSGRSR
ncbi:MAG TPA: hypothetical protein VGX00_08930 [Thermoplasmata archaeon]|nr:hypothetical protein [Thermoplasmata archaeon]